MGLCRIHWNALRRELQGQGLGDFIETDIIKATANAMDANWSQRYTIDNFDVTSAAGRYLLHTMEKKLGKKFVAEVVEKQACPVCMALERGSIGWVRQAAKYCREVADALYKEIKQKEKQ